MMPMAATHLTSGGQQTLLLVNGPNGPQYMIAGSDRAGSDAAGGTGQ